MIHIYLITFEYKEQNLNESANYSETQVNFNELQTFTDIWVNISR